MIALFVKNAAGIPITGLTPTWLKYVNAVTGADQAAPAVSALGNGHYRFTPSGVNPAGILDLGAAASPRYAHYSAISQCFTFAAYNDLGAPLAGLTPTWVVLVKVDGSGAYAPQPTISEIGAGLYKTDFLSTHVTGTIDLGSTAYPRYLHYDNEKLYQTLIIPIDE